MSLNFQQRKGSTEPSTLVLIAAVLLPFFAAAGFSWIFTGKIATWFPVAAGNFWSIWLVSFAVLVVLGMFALAYVCSPVCPQCGSRIFNDFSGGLDAPVIWARNILPPRSGVVIDLRTKCSKCGFDPGKGDFGGDRKLEK